MCYIIKTEAENNQEENVIFARIIINEMSFSDKHLKRQKNPDFLQGLKVMLQITIISRKWFQMEVTPSKTT